MFYCKIKLLWKLHMIFFQAAKAEAQIALEVGEALVAAAQ